MKATVTPTGVTIPRRLLRGVRQVDIRRENGAILVVPTDKEDPVRRLGKHPVRCGMPDASEKHDRYV